LPFTTAQRHEPTLLEEEIYEPEAARPVQCIMTTHHLLTQPVMAPWTVENFQTSKEKSNSHYVESHDSFFLLFPFPSFTVTLSATSLIKHM
jgi:hypothetical protein